MTPNPDALNNKGAEQTQEVKTTNNSKVCSNCGNPVSGKFCGNCGTPVSQKRFCTNCGIEVTGNFCTNCGTKA